MATKAVQFVCVTSFLVFGVSTILFALSFALNSWDHHVSFTEDFHLGLWRGRVVFFNDAEYGAYRGSIIDLVDSGDNVDPTFEREIKWGDSLGVYFRYFRSSDSTLWTLMVSLLWPLSIFGLPSAFSVFVWWRRRLLSGADKAVLMSANRSSNTCKWSLRWPTRLEWMMSIVGMAAAIALLLPMVQWASSGSIRFPVRVLVFDAAHGRPIPEAQVVIFRGQIPRPGMDIVSIRNRVPDKANLFERLPADSRGLTGKDGTAVVHYKFRTAASHKNPKGHTHLQFAWVVVIAKGYGTVVVPVRHDSMPTKNLREQKELFVPIGLMSVD